MVALTYESLGGISGVSENPKVTGSIRGRDRNNIQRFAFECDPLRPFTGIIHLQASVGSPLSPNEEALWFDIAEMIITNEGGTCSFEPVGEFSSLRGVCRTGNYGSAVYAAPAADQVIVSTGVGVASVEALGDVLDGTIGVGYEFADLRTHIMGFEQ